MSDLESVRSIAERTGLVDLLDTAAIAPGTNAHVDRLRDLHACALRLGEAWLIAVEVHGNQRDKGGDPYLFHIARVAMALQTDEERAVAILHDALEDCGSSARANDLYLRIVRAYGDEVGNAVAALTRMHNEPYVDYLRRVKENPLAVRVKLADLADNSRPERLAKLPAPDGIRLHAKYAAALVYLNGGTQ